MAALEASIAAAKSPGGRKASEKSSERREVRRSRPAAPRRSGDGKSSNGAKKSQRLRLAPQDGQEVARPVPARRVEVEVEGRTLSLSNLDKVMYPEVGFTKGQVIDYYTRVAPVLLPHLRGHPLTLKRYPDGVEGQFFYEKQCPSHRPDWVSTAPIPTGRKTIDFCLCEDLPDARLDGEPGRPRAAPVAVAGRPRSSDRP